MDREELDARIRQRRPGDARVRRGTPLDGDAAPLGYVPFEPQPEDARALREAAEPEQRVDNIPFETARPVERRAERPAEQAAPVAREWPAAEQRPRPAAPPPATPGGWESDGDPYGSAQDDYAPDDAVDAYADEDYAEDYAYAPPPRRRGGSGVLPVIGFVALAILALGVGAALAGVLGGPGVADATATPLATESALASLEPTAEPTADESGPAETPEPSDGPVTFPDGAVITVQPCATKDMGFNGCQVDGATITDPTMWVWIGFDDASSSDVFSLTLRSEGQTIDQQEQELGAVLTCPGTCSGYLIGAAYRDLTPGDYELVVRRNDDFADSATFTVEG